MFGVARRKSLRRKGRIFDFDYHYFGDIIGTSSSECERPWRREASVGSTMRLRQAGHVIVRANAASTWRRASGRLRRGGKSLRHPGGGGGGSQHRIAPDQAHQRQVAVQSRPHPALIIPQAEILFGILMQPLDRPATVAEPELTLQPVAVHT